MKTPMRDSLKAFSLVELSIVLVILGLLVGGILSGQALIRAAELRSVTADLDRYRAAIYTFRDKYFALPGDMTNATNFWSALDATHATCVTIASTGGRTCNGNGDGMLHIFTGSVQSEIFHSWVHLANAGLVEGTYSGLADTGGPKDALPGYNVPRGRISGTGFTLAYEGTWTPANFNNRNLILFGTATSAETFNDALSPAEARNLDMKIDDGAYNSGKLSGINTMTTPFCSAGTSYSLLVTANNCGVIAMMD